MKKLHFISGMPRSGSTLLCNLLNMNKSFHATATSPIIDVVRNIRSTYSHNPTFKSHDRPAQFENMQKGLKGFIEGFYFDKDIVFDKSRGWANQLPLIDTIMENEDTKIIWLYRNPVDIVNGMEAHYQKTILLENSDEASGVSFETLGSRVDTYINDGGLVARPVWALNDAFETGYGDRILIVRYDMLTTQTQEVMDAIHDFIGEERYQYDENDFEDLKQSTYEFDGFYNYKFPHTIKEGSIKYVERENKLPQHLVEKINHRFSWVNSLVNQ